MHLKSFIFLFVGCFLFGCAGVKVPAQESNLAQNRCLQGAPSWVLSGSAEGGISGVASSEIGKGGLTFARTVAIAGARDEIARSLSVKVSNMVKTFSQSTGVGDEETIDRVASNVSKQLASQTISNSKQIGSWISACNEIYVMLAVDPQIVAVETAKQTVSSFQKEKVLWQQFQSKNAQDELSSAVIEMVAGTSTSASKEDSKSGK